MDPAPGRTLGEGAPGPAPITVYGARTCEDTAVARSRLRALGVPFRDVDVDVDPAGLARVVALVGHRVTPTVTRGAAGAEGAVIAEPTIGQLETLVEDAGHALDRPAARHVHGPLAERPIPLRTVADLDGGGFSLETLRGRRQAVVLFAHDARCLTCFGYAKQLFARGGAMADLEAVPIAVVRDAPEAARAWVHEVADGARILADPAGAWAGPVRDAVGVPPDQVALLVLDRFAAPRAVSSAPEAGGLITPEDATEWLRYLVLECPECGNDVAWPGV